MSEVLVTGGAGFIGSHVVDRLVEDGHNVAVVDDFSTGLYSNVNNEAKIYTADIADGLFGKKPEGELTPNYDYIFHTAAKARVQPSIKDPVAWNKANVTGTLQVLELARKCGAKVIYSSTSSVYGDPQVLPTTEEHPINPKSPYGLQKYMGELYVKLYADLFDVDYTILRYFNVYGERQIVGGAYSCVIGTFLDQKKKGEPLTIRNDGNQSRDFTYVGDVAEANVLAMNWDRDVYNIGRGKEYSVNQIAKLIGGETIKGEEVVEPFATLAHNEKAKKAGWNPQGDVEAWIKANNVD